MTAARGALGKTHRVRNGFRLELQSKSMILSMPRAEAPPRAGNGRGWGRGRPQPRPKRLPPAVENVRAVESSFMHHSRRTRVKMMLAAAVF